LQFFFQADVKYENFAERVKLKQPFDAPKTERLSEMMPKLMKNKAARKKSDRFESIVHQMKTKEFDF
jgi:hypothetical protein